MIICVGLFFLVVLLLSIKRQVENTVEGEIGTTCVMVV